MKKLSPAFFILIIVPFLSIQITSQTIYEPSYDNQKEWLTDHGVADGMASANYQSGAVAAFVGAWAGVSAAEGGVKVYLPTDISDNTLIKVIAKVKFINATINYGFGSFAGTRIVYGGNSQYKSKDIDYGLSWENIYDKVEQIASLATGYGGISASLTLPNKVKKAVGYVKDIYDAVGLAQQLQSLNGNTETVSFTFKYNPDIVNVVNVGVRADASGALTGSAFGFISGQVTEIKVFTDGVNGEWIPIPVKPDQWIRHNRSEWDSEADDPWDYALKDNSGLGHWVDYYPLGVTLIPPNESWGQDNYIRRHRDEGDGTTPPNNVLTLNSISPSVTDEYFGIRGYDTNDKNDIAKEGTFEAWLKPIENVTYRGHIIHFSEDELIDFTPPNGWGGHEEIHLSVAEEEVEGEGGRFAFYIGDRDNSISLYGGNYQLDTEFYHVLGTYKNRNGKVLAALYLNGTQVAADSIIGSTLNLDLSNFIIGRAPDDDNKRIFRGQLKGIKVRGIMLDEDDALYAYQTSGFDTDPPDIPIIHPEPDYTPTLANMIGWNISNDTQTGIDYYIVEITNHSTSEVTEDSSSGSTYLAEGLTDGTNYSYRVKAVDNAGNISGWSSQESSIQDENKPTVPVINAEPAQTDGTSNTISWTASTDDLSDVLYWVQCSPDTLFDNDSTTTECYKEAGWISGTAKTFEGLSLDTKYYYRVKARDKAGNETEWSGIDSSVQYENNSFSTYYVSPDGDNGTGDGTLGNPWRLIGYAVEQCSDGDVIKVMDDDDSTTTDYLEETTYYDNQAMRNITVKELRIYEKSNITIERYDSDDSRPQIEAQTHFSNKRWAISVNYSDNITIRGLDIFGADNSDWETAGIYLIESDNCLIENCRIGWSSSQKNFFGLHLSLSTANTIKNNIIKHNYRGIYIDGGAGNVGSNIIMENNFGSSSNWECYLEDTHENVISDNTFTDSDDCIYLFQGCEYNTIVDNEASLHLADSRGVLLFTSGNSYLPNNISSNSFPNHYLQVNTLNNIITSNTFKDYTGGFNEADTWTSNNMFFMNNFMQWNSVEAPGDHSLWNTPIKVNYYYNSEGSKTIVGNYYNYDTGIDSDGDGLVDNSFTIRGAEAKDYAPLLYSTDNYDFQIWNLSDNNLLHNNSSTIGDLVPINTGQDEVWVINSPSGEAINFAIGTQSDSTTWSGFLTLADAISDIDSIKIEIGTCSTADGSDFEAAGPKASLCENDLSGKYITFCATASAVELNSGDYLALNITNYSKNMIRIRTGGSWSYISSTESSAALPVELTNFDAELVDEGVKLNWETATEVNNYGFQVQRKKKKDQSENQWDDIGFVQGHGSTSSPKQYSFIDANLPDTSEATYRLKQIDNDGRYGYSKEITIDISSITSVDDLLPTEYSLSQNYPNPFNPITTIKFGLPEQGFVDLCVYNILGQEVSRLVSKELNEGFHEISFGNSTLASGVYFYRIEVKGKFNSVKKMLLVK